MENPFKLKCDQTYLRFKGFLDNPGAFKLQSERNGLRISHMTFQDSPLPCIKAEYHTPVSAENFAAIFKCPTIRSHCMLYFFSCHFVVSQKYDIIGDPRYETFEVKDSYYDNTVLVHVLLKQIWPTR